MSHPEHVNPEYNNRVAVAPYNFVPLPEEIKVANKPPQQDRYTADLLTGKFTCTLTAASPLYVRAAQTMEQYQQGDKEKEKPADFFYGEEKDKLLIPGSSLRGMLRNMVEIVSASRLAPVTGRPLFFRTLDDTSLGKFAYAPRMTGGDPATTGYYPLSQAGYMEKHADGYTIRPAQSLCDTQYYRVEEDLAVKKISTLKKMSSFNDEENRWDGTKHPWFRKPVWFKPVKPVKQTASALYFANVTELETGETQPDGEGWVRGELVVSGWVPAQKGKDGQPKRGKHRHWIIGPAETTDENLVYVDDEDIDLYKDGGGISQTVEDQKMSVLPSKKGECIACFYSLWEDEAGKQRVAFGHTAMFRLPYEKTPAQLLPDDLRLQAGLDLAQALFGHVPAKKGQGETVAGRVFVTDGILKGKAAEAVLGVTTLKILSSPKPTTFQHYLTQSQPDDPKQLRYYDSHKEGQSTTLRGHKLYWHQRNVEKANYTADPDQFNQFKSQYSPPVTPVKEGTTFSFTIHFENLLPAELGALLWVLEKAQQEQYRLKLGMGKPYGLGSVGIKHDVILSGRVSRYQKLFDGSFWNEGNLEPGDNEKKLENARQALAGFLGVGNYAAIDDQKRMKEFLALLSWTNHPGPEWTKYMELKMFTGKIPVVKGNSSGTKRPVLPDATKVVDPRYYAELKEKAPTSKPVKTGSKKEEPVTPPASKKYNLQAEKPKIPPAQARDPNSKREKASAVDKPLIELAPGDVIFAKIVQIRTTPKDVVLQPEKGRDGMDKCTNTDEALRRRKVGTRVKLIITTKSGDEKRGWTFTCSLAD